MEAESTVGAANAAEHHNSQAVDPFERLQKMIAEESEDYDAWGSIIKEIENMYPDNLDTISVMYDSFLSKFPLCYWYWNKYAYHNLRLSKGLEACKIFDRAAESATYALGTWLCYCNFSTTFFADPSEIRRVFDSGLCFVERDYCCHELWDRYLAFEFSQKNLRSVAYITVRALKYPTKKLHKYYEDFKMVVAKMEEDMLQQNNFEGDRDSTFNEKASFSKAEIFQIIKDLEDPSIFVRFTALHKYKHIGETWYEKANQFHEKVKGFEANIKRRYFQLKPLDGDELENWHNYLDFIEKQGDFLWALNLYERCLISCVVYPEFWMRYVNYLEGHGGRELAIAALDRATHTFLKNVPEIHIFNARYKERIGDASGARAAYIQSNRESDFDCITNAIEQANAEKRMGNLTAACNIYEKAIRMAVEKENLHALPKLYTHLYRLKYMITGNADAARDVIIDGILRVPHCKLLLEELIKFSMLHEGSKQLNLLDPIVANAISPSDACEGLNKEDREEISRLFLEFVDLCGSVHDLEKAWNRHIRLFPQFLRTGAS